MTDDEADMRLLTTANEHGKFAMALGETLGPTIQAAFERGIVLNWFTFVDLSPLSTHPKAGLYRIFKLTVAGRARLAQLQQQIGTRDAPMR